MHKKKLKIRTKTEPKNPRFQLFSYKLELLGGGRHIIYLWQLLLRTVLAYCFCCLRSFACLEIERV